MDKLWPNSDVRASVGLFILLLVFFFTPVTAAEDPPAAPESGLVMHQPYRICTGDQLEVVYALRDNVTRAMVIVRTDGMVSLPYVDDVQAAGLRLDELSVKLREKYSVVYRQPKIDVILRHSTAAKAFVGGEVEFDGIISLRHPVTVREALIRAGGTSPHGNRSRVIVVRKVSPTETSFFELDLTNKNESLTEAGMFYLQAGDMVLVPMKGIAKVRLWSQQYIFRTLSLVLTTEFSYFFKWLRFDNYYRF